MISDVKISRNVAEHRGVQLSRVAMKINLDDLAGQPGGVFAVGYLRSMFGEEMVQWVGYDQTRLFQVIEPDLEAAKRRIDQVLDGRDTIAGNGSFQQAIARMPARNSLIVLMDVPELVAGVVRQMAAAFSGQPAPASPPGTASYAAFALAAEPTVLSVSLWVPSGSIGQMIRTFQGLRGDFGEVQ